MTNKPPASQFYWNDFTCDVDTWSNEEVGAYMRLLASEWTNGPLPKDMKRLSRIARQDHESFLQMWDEVLSSKFHLRSGRWCNKRMEDERLKMQKRAKVRAKLGKQGAKKRWKRDSIAKAIVKPMANEWQRKIEDRRVKKEDKTPPEEQEKVLIEETVTKIEELFDKWWSEYPNKVDKERAMKLFSQAIAETPEKKRRQLIKDLFGKLAAYKQSPKWLKDDGEYVPMPSTWLHRKRWQDEIKTREQAAKEKEAADQERYKEMEEAAARRNTNKRSR